MRELHLFAGAGGGILGGMLLGHRTVCAVEIEPYCRKVLLQRQRDGILPWFPIWDDVRTFDGKPWRGIADVVCGGFPCQDISCANPDGKGLDGERSGLWFEMRRIICEIRPRIVFVENSPMLTIRGLGRVLGDLAEMGFNARWGVLGAGHLGAPHKRERIWIFADSDKTRQFSLPKPTRQLRTDARIWESFGTDVDADKLAANGAVYGKDNVMAGDVDRIAALGNGQVPIVAATAWEILST